MRFFRGDRPLWSGDCGRFGRPRRIGRGGAGAGNPRDGASTYGSLCSSPAGVIRAAPLASSSAGTLDSCRDLGTMRICPKGRFAAAFSAKPRSAARPLLCSSPCLLLSGGSPGFRFLPVFAPVTSRWRPAPRSVSHSLGLAWSFIFGGPQGGSRVSCQARSWSLPSQS